MGGADKRCSSRVTGCASICSSFNVSVESERSSSLSDAGGVELSGDGSRGVCSVICSLSLATTELSDALLKKKKSRIRGTKRGRKRRG